MSAVCSQAVRVEVGACALELERASALDIAGAGGGAIRINARPGVGRRASVGQSLRAKWREVVRGKPAAERVAWLKTAEAIAALGSKVCKDLVRQIEQPRGVVDGALAAPAWGEDWWERGGELPPGLEVGGEQVVMSHCEMHRHGVRVTLSRASTRYGGGPARRRWTPPQAVEVEDMLDEMSVVEAVRYEFAASPSAEAIRRIGELRGREE